MEDKLRTNVWVYKARFYLQARKVFRCFIVAQNVGFQSKTIPAPENLPNVRADAHRIFLVHELAKMAVVPSKACCGLMVVSAEMIERAFAAKQRHLDHT